MNYFYHPNPETDNHLSNEESFHCIKVLRKRQGQEIDVIDGLGNVFTCVIEKESHRSCVFYIVEKKQIPRAKDFHIHVIIAPTKNQDRIEWFVEKACELAIDEITFIQTTRTERKKLNLDRIEKKAISAMKQSKNLYKTKINGLVSLSDFLKHDLKIEQKFIAFVDHDNPEQLFNSAKAKGSYMAMIGPEGDFTNEEVVLAKNADFQMISLGKSVLRTETAGIVACHTLNLLNS